MAGNTIYLFIYLFLSPSLHPIFLSKIMDDAQTHFGAAHLQTHTEWENGYLGQTKKKKNKHYFFVLPTNEKTLCLFKVFCVNGWVLEIAPNLHWVSSQVTELITGVIQNSNIFGFDL